jgi:hypothetical protein
MTIHTTRDFLTTASAVAPGCNVYLLTLFLTGVLGFSRVGQTNMNIVPLASGTVTASRGASINLGSGKEYFVFVPTASYSVPTSSDNGKILVLKSYNYSRYNSGLFRVLSGSSADNAFIVDWRSTGGAYPPIESGSLSGSLDWMLFASENTFAQSEGSFADNGETGKYRTKGSATYPRTILQSPHTSSWQVRICLESSEDRNNGGTKFCGNTIAPGYSGNLAGDFSAGGDHLHGALFFDNFDGTSTGTSGKQVGLDPGLVLGGGSPWKSGQWRVFIWGNDQTGTTIIVNRNVTDMADGWALFGLPENEAQINLPKNVMRLFTIGDSNQGGSYLRWRVGSSNTDGLSGLSFGYSGQPISCVMQTYGFITDLSVFAGKPRDSASAADSPFLSATELIPVDLLTGTYDTLHTRENIQNTVLEPRRLGQVPMARLGRSNFGDWTLTSDTGRSWFHIKDGIFLPWGGPQILP